MRNKSEIAIITNKLDDVLPLIREKQIYLEFRQLKSRISRHNSAVSKSTT
ncbi:MAG TPA: hypothetical protein VHO84_09080 [Syntrophorhabdaceae bacterium]|nr:hypothetical protein [Syntrophorhabdaceae bacterium]